MSEFGPDVRVADRYPGPNTCRRSLRRIAVLNIYASVLTRSLCVDLLELPAEVTYVGVSPVHRDRRDGSNQGGDDPAGSCVLPLGEPTPVEGASALQPSPLTKREREVAELVAAGMTTTAIAACLVVSPRTVEGQVEHILTKLGFRSRAQVAAWVVSQAEPDASAPDVEH
uniref:HTH luxR-type domain-containing protein n=1 Tax=Rhodococcus sp. NS1 TaxID=402236 RepID=A0A097SQ03_9NOCA|nr:hypothetical protein LRS1606.173 [Rhodococcus sp. NS1]